MKKAFSEDFEVTLSQLSSLAVSNELREVEGLLANFNLFRVLKFEHGEIRHSNMLSWLLQPDEMHGLGDEFIRRWLMQVFHDASVTDPSSIEIDSLEIRFVRVAREWKIPGGFLDLLVRIETVEGDEWVFAIENKIHSGQSKGQLQRYRDAVEAAFPKIKRKHFIFLSKIDQKPADPIWLKSDYKQLHSLLKELWESHKDLIGPEPSVLIQHYLELISEATMSKERIGQLAKTLYQNHRDALDAILEHRPDFIKDLSDRLAELLDKEAQLLQIVPMLCQKYVIRFIPAEWDTQENRQGKAWGNQDSSFVLCQLTVDEETTPSFVIVEGKSPDDWRDKLWKLSKEQKFPTVQQRTKMPKKWMTIYSVQPDFAVSEEESPDVEATAIRLWDWVKQEMKEEEFKSAVSRVAEHLKTVPLAT